VVDFWKLNFLSQMRPNDIPAFITPEDVISGLLHDRVLPRMPLVRPARDLTDDIEDLMAPRD
jgi:hypothetical protein